MTKNKEKQPYPFLFFSADLFDILLPMLNIYQEFVRNHQYSLQVLANCKQNRDFDKLLKQYEANPACEGRMLETFLTYPMFQVSYLGHDPKFIGSHLDEQGKTSKNLL